MEAGFIVPVLALITLLAGIVYAIWSKRETERQLRDPNDPKSSLAVDGPSHQNKDERKETAS
ncbi:hypothetical protein OCH239_02185 [Roseivivax halodurans JCM 10272]|uniref:Uncharacterized protein n=1 Tax=Roseivivax halodurans JCM 10272 TaxID=1449350 RepID=X7EL74_9RHOB|nr:hypothetical protein [Roseivivax halodurans]ETX16655.1 hypothetical protein OCH239_02185 [Roseivivax halodurans JCM 10272]